MFSGISKYITIGLIGLIVIGVIVFFIQRASLIKKEATIKDLKNKIELLNIQIKGYQLQSDIQKKINEMDRLTYEKKKKLLQELYGCNLQLNCLLNLLNRLHTYNRPSR